ncbi:MAG: hypothetical protein P3B98_01745 [Gemmatimonadota bacterium]|nr:hypothetical protein [Gemmatimonadota bacterium]
MISLRSRILRSLLAASTLHLMLAVPARACAPESALQTSMDTHVAHEQAAPMSHAGHQMAPPAEQSPVSPDAPGTTDPHHMPCCPSPASGCASVSCAAPLATVSAVAVSAPDTPATRIHARVDGRWISVAHAPEPPPPRA